MIVLDAGVVIAYLAPADAHHHAAEEFLLRATVELLVNPVTLAEILVFPTRENRVEEALATLSDIGVVESPFPTHAGRNLAALRASTGLKMPDCCVLLTAMDRQATLASFDDKLRRVALGQGVRPEFG